MSQQQVSSVQVQMAASAGLQVLAIKDLPVPMEIAKSGSLSVLEGILGALARGELILAPPPPEKKEDIGKEETPPLTEVPKVGD